MAYSVGGALANQAITSSSETEFFNSLPTGCPHRLTQDDWYDGMLLPKNATIVVPTDTLHQTERCGYDDPKTFKPERYLGRPKLANDYAGSPEYSNRDHYGYG